MKRVVLSLIGGVAIPLLYSITVGPLTSYIKDDQIVLLGARAPSPARLTGAKSFQTAKNRGQVVVLRFALIAGEVARVPSESERSGLTVHRYFATSPFDTELLNHV